MPHQEAFRWPIKSNVGQAVSSQAIPIHFSPNAGLLASLFKQVVVVTANIPMTESEMKSEKVVYRESRPWLTPNPIRVAAARTAFKIAEPPNPSQGSIFFLKSAS